MLAGYDLIAFVPTADAVRARAFYVDVLGLAFVADDGFALVVKTHLNMIRIVRMGAFTPVQYTVLGWEVPELASKVRELSAAGVEFLKFPGLTQDELGIWTAPDGSAVAWFRDPDGNVLSMSKH